MQRLLAIMLMLFFIMGILPAHAQEDLDETFEWQPYGLTIDYPSGWLTSYYADSGFYAIAEEADDIQNLTLDPAGQVFIIWPIEGERLDTFGDDPEAVVEFYASSTMEDFRERDMDEFETDNDYEMVFASGEGSDGGFLIVASTTGPSDILFLFIGASPRRDDNDLEDNVRAMLDTLELEAPQDIIESGRADDATPIEYGDTVEGEITNRRFAEEYVFEGAEGDIVTISMTKTSNRDDLDTLLILIDQQGRQVASNDDIDTSGGNYNSRIASFVLPADGLYIIIATRFQQGDGTSTGEYELTLEARSSESLGAGEEILAEEGEITNRRPSEEYTFEANEGDIVTITMIDTSRDDGLDPLIILLDPDGNEIARNDDASDTGLGLYNSQIFAFELPQDGEYTIIATRFQEEEGDSEGEYELTVIRYESGEFVQDNAIEYGETIRGEITDDDFQQTYTFEGSEGDIVTITMIDTSEDDTLDPLLILLDPEGSEIERNDDGSASIVGEFNSQIRNFTLPTDGTYTIIATRFSQEEGSTVGAYELSLQEGEQTSDEGK
jgi:hypothetical protein